MSMFSLSMLSNRGRPSSSDAAEIAGLPFAAALNVSPGVPSSSKQRARASSPPKPPPVAVASPPRPSTPDQPSPAEAFAKKWEVEQTKKQMLLDELELVRAQVSELLEDQRRSEHLNATPSEHIVLSAHHAGEALARSLAWCCEWMSAVLRGCVAGAAGSRSRAARPLHALPRDDEEDSVAGRASSLLGEEGANDTHLARKMRRSAPARGLVTKPEIASKGGVTKPESASKGGVTKPSPKGDPKHARVPEDNPELVAAMGRWCAGHVSKQVRAISLRSRCDLDTIAKPRHASTRLCMPRVTSTCLEWPRMASSCLAGVGFEHATDCMLIAC